MSYEVRDARLEDKKHRIPPTANRPPNTAYCQPNTAYRTCGSVWKIFTRFASRFLYWDFLSSFRNDASIN